MNIWTKETHIYQVEETCKMWRLTICTIHHGDIKSRIRKLSTRNVSGRQKYRQRIRGVSAERMQVCVQRRRLRWSRGSVLAFGTQVGGLKPDRSRWIFQGEKILSTPSFGGEVKPSVPYLRFTACERSLNVTWKSGIFRQNLSAIFRPCSSNFGC